ncbi:bifunctional enoyl-CoA hydratase/phosphate acetyltransferase [Burkholderia anthina]|uniref:bifunctional enoyl-CoA hydratase/phosphate acetyltransferase n=1 Tax=Burkholderia anthina TaxID=179879 RepID=UPI00158DB829|nr:bifunctional enoyl-CoA hydratase/phosphate acetyltransferase [Burkholderia anthina]MBY4868879.1 bifunctional enoyl-CoA hydratase/phosphate acetyltransferase [Burkholderia anthina]
MNQERLTNRPFDTLAIGDSASLTRTASRDDIDLFAALSGDVNPAHVDAAFAAHDPFGHVVVHGMWTGALVSAVLGTQLPGPGTIYLDQTLEFRHPVAPGDTITATVTVKEKRPDKRIVLLDTRCTNQAGQVVLTGTATVIAPDRPLTVERTPRPDVSVRRHDRYEAFIRDARARSPLRTAIVHPCSPDALRAALEARDANLLDPLLIGPEARIRAVADTAQVSLAGIDIEPVEHSHAAAARAVELGAAGKVAALMKGSVHTDELLAAVVAPTSGLRTDRRISHVYAMDIPAYPKPLVITDAAINIAPSLDQKRDICQNAIDLLRLLGVEQPHVAVLAAVETVNARMPATLDAAALTVMAARGQISNAIVDGPLAFDNAISAAAAQSKGIGSPVAGRADILLVPDLEAGNMLAKQLMYFAGADGAGLVLGARLPIILTSRSDSLRVRLASAALAKLVAERTAERGSIR